MIDVEVKGDYKTLYFNRNFVQGRTHKSGKLAVHYMKEIVKVFDHVVDVRHVLLLGLGAGNLHTYLLKKYPKLHIDTIEINPEVVQVAKKHFNLPNTKRLRIFTEDVKKFIQEVHNYDIVIVDVYDENGQVMLDDRWVKKQGKVIVYNSLVCKDTYKSYITQLNTLYDRVHEEYIPELTSEPYNHIAYCFNND